MSDIRILVCVVIVVIHFCLPCKSAQDSISPTEHELARQILSNKDLP